MFNLVTASAQYDNETVLSDISLLIPRGQKLALVGHSGSGKSTLLKLLHTQRPQDVSLIPQEYGLVLSLSVFHNIYMGDLKRQLLWHNVLNLIKPQQRFVEVVTEILQRVGLQDKLFEPAGQLSGGQQQRCAIARALYRNADILLADEPVSSLDEQQSRQIMSLLCQRFDTVVLALHDIDLALQYCDRIIGLDHGRIRIDTPAAELSRNDLLALYGD